MPPAPRRASALIAAQTSPLCSAIISSRIATSVGSDVNAQYSLGPTRSVTLPCTARAVEPQHLRVAALDRL